MTNTDINLDRRTFVKLAGGTMLSGAVFWQPAGAQNMTVLVTCISGDPPSFNPAITSGITTLQAASPIYSHLVRLDLDAQVSPDLAESWEVSEDGKVFTFYLRQDVFWHDGVPFTSADAKFTIEEIISRLNPIAAGAYQPMESIVAPDDYTLVITFSRPNNPFFTLAYAFGPILPRHLWEGTDFAQNPAANNPIGTGPFKFLEYNIGDAIRLERYENYHLDGPYFEELVIRIIPDAVARAAAFENGEVDCMWSALLPSNEVSRLASLPGVATANSYYSGGAWLLIFNTRTGPLEDRLVRQALAHAIDRRFLRDHIMSDIAEEMVGPLYPGSPLYNEELEDYALDPDTANRILDEAGFPRGGDGTRFTLEFVWRSSENLAGRIAEVVAQNLREIGVVVNFNSLEDQSVYQRMADTSFDVIIQGSALGPDPEFGFERYYNSNNITNQPSTNNAGYVNEAIDELFDQQRRTTTFAERKEIYDQIQEILWDDLPTLPIFAFPTQGIYAGDRISGVYRTFSPLGEHFGTTRPV